ncbi:MAG TPA: hypothetical protein VF707_08755, partial [Ardenticatenaceae bacterium]
MQQDSFLVRIQVRPIVERRGIGFLELLHGLKEAHLGLRRNQICCQSIVLLLSSLVPSLSSLYHLRIPQGVEARQQVLHDLLKRGQLVSLAVTLLLVCRRKSIHGLFPGTRLKGGPQFLLGEFTHKIIDVRGLACPEEPFKGTAILRGVV